MRPDHLAAEYTKNPAPGLSPSPDEATGGAISAAIIAGGRSTRMGADKALLTLVPGGPTLLDLILQALCPLTDDLMIIASGRPDYQRSGARLVPDHYPGDAALGAIATALEAAFHPRCLVVGCDTPFLERRLLAYLVQLDADADIVVPVISGESRQGASRILQTLHAVYGPGCLEPIRARLRLHQRQVIGFFPAVRVREVPEETVRVFDPDLRSFFNVNTPAALERARSLARAPGAR